MSKMTRMVWDFDDNQLQLVLAARGGRLLKKNGRKTLTLRIECRYGHVFGQTLPAIFDGAWCPICQRHEQALRAQKKQQERYEQGRLYALAVLAYEYPQWFHQGPPYLPPMRNMTSYLLDALQADYPELTAEMVHAAIRYIELQPDYYTCLIEPGPRYRPDGTPSGQLISEVKAAQNREKYLRPVGQPNYVLAYSDGSCNMGQNPWCGTWAYVIYDINSMCLLAKDAGTVYAHDQRNAADTVQLAELTAAIMALHWCRQHGALKVQLCADATCVATDKTLSAKQRQRASHDLITAGELYYGEVRRLGTHLLRQKIKGHSKIWPNELVDAMCRRQYRYSYRRGRVAIRALAQARRQPWLRRQLSGTRIHFQRAVIRPLRRQLRPCEQRLRHWAFQLGCKLVRFGKGK